MNIVHIIGSMSPSTGGTCHVVRSINNEFQKREIYSEVVCLDDPSDDFLIQYNFIIHALGPNIRPWAYSPKLYPWLSENLSRFDAVIMHGLWLYPSYEVWKSIREIKRNLHKLEKKGKLPRFFIMPHGMLDPYFQFSKKRKIKAIRNWIYWKLIEHKVVNYADGILFTSETELLLARKSFQPYRPKQEINVGYGINEPPLFTPTMQNEFSAKCPELQNRPYILFFGRVNYKKGVDLLVNAYYTILCNHLEYSKNLPRLVIAGPGLESKYGQMIVRFVYENPVIKDNVFFPGMLTADAKWGAIYGCEAFILPSHQENFGIAVVESLACGKPVLISDQINIWQEIKLANCGFVAADSLEGVQNMLKSWLRLSNKEQIAMALKARSTFEQKFHIDQSIKRLIDVLRL